MLTEILIGVVVTVVAGFLAWLGARVVSWRRRRRDCRRVYSWLEVHTRNEPGESHASTATIAAGALLEQEKVVSACLMDKRIYRSERKPDLWSIWRAEPQSVYEKRGVITI